MQRTTAVYLGNNTAVTKTVFGDKIFVDTRDLALAPHLLLDGMWEQWISDAMIPMLRCDTFVDVGANFGWYTLLAARFGAEHIHAIEAVLHTYDLLRRTCQVNGLADRADTHLFAADDSYRTLAISDPEPRNLGGLSLLGSKDATAQVDSEELAMSSSMQELRTTPIDGLVTSVGKTVVLKIDVEGMEPRAVLGARQLITSNKTTAFVEYHADPGDENKLKQMLDLFEQQGFSMGHVLENTQIKPINRNQLASLRDAEMLCFRRFDR